MAVRVGVYLGHSTEQRPDALVADLGLDPTGEAVLTALRAAPPAAWVCLMAAEEGMATFLPLAQMDLTKATRLITAWG